MLKTIFSIAFIAASLLCKGQIEKKQVVATLKKNTETGDTSISTTIKRADTIVIKKQSIREEKIANIMFAWSDWKNSPEYPAYFMVRYGKPVTSFDSIVLEVKNIGHVSIEGDFFAYECSNNNTGDYKKLSLEPEKVARLKFKVENCAGANTIKWACKNIGLWSPKEDITFYTTSFHYGNEGPMKYSGWIKSLWKNNRCFLQMELTNKTHDQMYNSFNGDITVSRASASNCREINGWHRVQLSMNQITMTEFDDKSSFCGQLKNIIGLQYFFKPNLASIAPVKLY